MKMRDAIFAPVYGCCIKTYDSPTGKYEVPDEWSHIIDQATGESAIKEFTENKKLYRVLITVSYGNTDSTREINRETIEKYFNSLEAATNFANTKPGVKVSPLVCASSKIFEYEVSSIRELQQKTRPVEVVVKSETYWE